MNGRRHLNFSEWLRPDVDDPAEYTRQKFISACRELKLGRMPLFSYELLHPGTPDSLRPRSKRFAIGAAAASPVR